MHKILEVVCDEIDELERKADKSGKLTMQEIEYLDKLAHIKKSLLAADEMMGESGRSSRGSSRRSYEGSSYARRRDSQGRYSREGSYSMADDDFRMELQELMQDAPNDQMKQKLQRLMSEM